MTDKLQFNLSEFLPYRLNIAAVRVSRDFAHRYRERFGLNLAEWRVLAYLHTAGSVPVSIRDIEAKVGMEKSKVSRAVARLDAVGYLSKAVSAQDRRLLDLSLTDAGRALLAELLPLALEFQADLRAGLGEDAPALDRVLDRLLG